VEVCLFTNQPSRGGVAIMARAKLTGSLLAYKDAPAATTPPQHLGAMRHDADEKALGGPALVWPAWVKNGAEPSPAEDLGDPVHRAATASQALDPPVVEVTGGKASGNAVDCRLGRPDDRSPALRWSVSRAVVVATFVLAVGSVSGFLFLQSIEGKVSAETALPVASPTTDEQPANKIVEDKPPALAKAATVTVFDGAPDAVAADAAPAPSDARLPLVMVPAPPQHETPSDDPPTRPSDIAPVVAAADPATVRDAPPALPKIPAAAPHANLPVDVTYSSTAPIERPGLPMLNQALNSALLARGDALFVSGDLASARLFYERAANAGDGHAALRLGETFDPAFLARTGLVGFRANASVAAYWYRRAGELGVSDGKILLQAIAAETGH
jgi:hypothetical protein